MYMYMYHDQASSNGQIKIIYLPNSLPGVAIYIYFSLLNCKFTLSLNNQGRSEGGGGGPGVPVTHPF